MADLLLELRSEEIPARMQVRAGQDLSKMMTKGLKDAGLDVSDVTVFTGPRRLVFAASLPARSPDVREERKGPRVGSPEQALAGFMKAAGLTDISQAETREDKKGEHYVAIIERAGRDAADVLAELIPSVMGDFPWPKSMRSGDSTFRWVRPLRGIVALLDGKVVPVDVGGIVSGNTTEGHRQHGSQNIVLTGPANYARIMDEEGYVVVDHEARKASIREQIENLLTPGSGLQYVEDEGLMNEVAGLVEWPQVFIGDMDPAFLDLPEDVIRLTLKSHQKTFTVRDRKTGKLAPHFVIVANIEPSDGGPTIKAGNAKVIGARLSDAAFFIETDAKTTLAEHAKGLERVVFHDKLGSFADKVERVAALAREIAPHVGADPDLAEQAARLAKADLVTGTVIEMTSLQGQIGRMMAEREGIDADVAAAIEDHYKPQGPSDAVPTAPVSVALALADKLDSLVSFWAIDEKPTGSKDPYALRRAALGVVRIILKNEVSESIDTLIMYGEGKLRSVVSDRLRDELSGLQSENDADKLNSIQLARLNYLSSPNRDEAIYDASTEEQDGLANLLGEFLRERLRGILRDQGYRHDIIDAVVIHGGPNDFFANYKSVKAVSELLGTTEGENLVAGYKRAANILRAERKKGKLELLSIPSVSFDEIVVDLNSQPPRNLGSREVLNEADFNVVHAKALYNALLSAAPAIDAQLDANDYPAALSTLATLRAPVDAFFDSVMVNSDDADERIRRLSLLQALVDTAHRIADFSKLDG